METLHRLLDACQRLAPEYAAGLSTHLPMALQALYALGADDAALVRFHARHEPRMPARGPTHPSPARPGADAVAGDEAAFEALRARYVDALRRRGRAPVVREAIGRLADGVAARAFHGVIRVAHALDAGHDAELASGLAYWHARHAPLPAVPPAGEADDDPCGPRADALRRAWRTALHDLPSPTGPRARLIADRVQAWAAVPGAVERASRWPIGAHPAIAVHALAREAAGLYRATGDFTVLHVVTGSRATWRLLGHAPDPAAFARHLAVAAGLALRASGVDLRPVEGADPPDDAPPWDAIVPAATASDDEHVVKLVAACRELAWEGDPGGVFRGAAARAVRTS